MAVSAPSSLPAFGAGELVSCTVKGLAVAVLPGPCWPKPLGSSTMGAGGEGLGLPAGCVVVAGGSLEETVALKSLGAGGGRRRLADEASGAGPAGGSLVLDILALTAEGGGLRLAEKMAAVLPGGEGLAFGLLSDAVVMTVMLLGLVLRLVPLLKTSLQVSVTMDTVPSSLTMAVK